MSRQIHHRNLEQAIGRPCHCDDYLQLKVVGYYPTQNNIAIAARRGEDKFFLAARDRKTDISEAMPLTGRYLIIGDRDNIDERILNTCALQNKTDAWLPMPDDLFTSRLLIAGAARIITLVNELSNALALTPEYKQAIADRRVIEIVC